MIAAAQDAGGEADAGPHYDRAKATFVTLLDQDHAISSLYRLQNVPMGVWIDEKGFLVRPPEVAYSRSVSLLQIKVDGDRYVAALRDWAINGEKSPFAMTPAQIAQKVGPRSKDEERAEASFKLAVHLQKGGKGGVARKHFAEAQRLAPDNWNYHRQDWHFIPGASGVRWLKKYNELKGREYYPKLELPPAPAKKDG